MPHLTQLSAPSKAGWFASTHWSLVLAAQEGDSAMASDALEKLCRTYWPPLYAFIRREGYHEAEAKDLTQEFFLRLIDRELLKHLRHQRGKFRSFLLAFLKNFLLEQRGKAQAQKRGGGKTMVSLEDVREGGSSSGDSPLRGANQFQRNLSLQRSLGMGRRALDATNGELDLEWLDVCASNGLAGLACRSSGSARTSRHGLRQPARPDRDLRRAISGPRWQRARPERSLGVGRRALVLPRHQRSGGATLLLDGLFYDAFRGVAVFGPTYESYSFWSFWDWDGVKWTNFPVLHFTDPIVTEFHGTTWGGFAFDANRRRSTWFGGVNGVPRKRACGHVARDAIAPTGRSNRSPGLALFGDIKVCSLWLMRSPVAPTAESVCP